MITTKMKIQIFKYTFVTSLLCAGFFLGATSAHADITTGLVAHYPLDASSGTTVVDASGNGNNGTLLGSPLPTWTTGKIGSGGLQFHGTAGSLADRVTVPGSSSLNVGTGDFSVSFWVKTNNATSPPVETYFAKTTSSGDHNIIIYVQNGFVRVYVNDLTFRGSVNVADSVWHHIAVVRQSGVVTLYTDTSSYNSDTGNAASMNMPGDTDGGTQNLYLGVTYDISDTAVGIEDDVRFYNRALSQADVMALYNLGGGDQTGPTVSVTAPSSGASVLGTSVTLSATAADNIQMAGVQFKVDGTNVGTEVTTASNGTYSTTWDTSTFSNGSHTISAVARDTSNNLTTATQNITIANDLTPPAISGGLPTGTVAANTTQVTLQVTTDKASTCRYSPTANVAYASMSNTLGGTAVTTHAGTITGLQNNTSYTFYIRCQVTSLNPTTSDYSVSFTVGQDTTAPVISAIGTSNIQQTSATINWATNETATSKVDYGTTNTYGFSTTLDSSLTTSHAQALTGLSANTTYHYRVRSKDASNNESISTPDQTFTTGGATLAGTNIYIAQTTAGSDTGADCSNAHSADWFNASGIVVVNGVAQFGVPTNWGSGTGQIGPGDTVHFCGTISTSLHVWRGGTAGNPITFKFESGAKLSAPTWGTDTNPESPSTKPAIFGSNTSYIVLDGTNGLIEATDNGLNRPGRTFGHYVAATGVSFSGDNGTAGITGVEIKNITMRNLVQSWASPDIAVAGNGITMGGVINDVLIHDNNLDMIGNGIIVSYSGPVSRNVKVYSNTITRNSWGMFINSTDQNGAEAYGYEIYNNRIDDFNDWDPPSGEARGSFHSDCIILNVGGGGQGTMHGIKIYNNYLGPNLAEMSAPIYMAPDDYHKYDSPSIFNNVIVAGPGTNPANAFIVAAAKDAKVVNNSLISLIDPNGGAGGNGTGPGNGGTAYNNLFYKMGNPVLVWLTNGATNVDYNAYDIAEQWVGVDENYQTHFFNFAGWKVQFPSYDAHSNFEHPLLDSSYRLLANDTAARAQGINLTSYCGQVPEL
ncbi:MAG: LamG-like jellyroll fold domain-containing protein, partial [Patescibacteria group bacterium]